MTEYDSLPALRQALASDDADERTEAYSAVFSVDLDPSDVLSNEPPEDALRERGVIPGEEQVEARADREKRMVELLERIAEAVEGQ